MSVDAGSVALALQLNSTSFEKSVSSVAKKAAGVLASALAVNGLKDFTQQCISLGSTLTAAESTFSTVFGNLESQAEQSLSSIAEQSGNTADALRSSFTQIASFAKTTGVDTAEALDLTTRATTAAADIAAFYDKSIDNVTDSLQSFLKGNYENDAALGLSCTETTRNAAANELYGKSFANLSEAQKQLTLLQMVEDANAASGALGQAARESQSWAVQSQYLGQQVQSFMSNIGAGLINLLTPALNAINVMMGRIVKLASAFRSLTEMLFGTSSTGGASGVASDLADASDSSASLAASLTDGSSALSGLGSATGSAAKSLGKASKTATALKRSLEGFDQITRVSEDTSSSGTGSSGSGTGSGTGSSGGISTADVDTSGLDSLTDAAETATESLTPLTGAWKKFADFVNGMNFKPLQTAWNSLKKSGERLGKVFSGALQWGLENVLEPLTKWTIEEAAPAGLDLLSAALDVLSSVCETLEEPAQWIWDNFLEPIAEWTGDMVVAALEALTGALTGLSDWIDENQALIQNVVVPLAAFFAAITGGQAVVGIITAITAALATIGPAVSAVAAAVANFGVFGVLKGLLYSVVGAGAPFIVAIAAIIAAGVLLYKNWDKVKIHLEAAWEGIKNAAMPVLNALKAFWAEHGEQIKTALLNIWTGIKTRLIAVWTAIKTVASAAFTVIKTIALTVFGALKSFWDTWGGTIIAAFTAIFGTLQTVFCSAWEIIKAVFGAELDVLTDLFAVFAAVFAGDWGAVWENIKQLASDVWDGIRSVIGAVLNAVKTIVSSWAKTLKKVVSEAWCKLKTNVVKTVTNLKKAAVSKFTEIKKKVENTVTNLKKKVTDTWDKLKNSVTDTVDNIKSGITETWEGLKESVTNTVDSIKSGVTETWDNIKGSLTDTMDGIKSGIAEKWEAAKKTVEETVDKITSKINGIQEDVEEAGGIVEYSVGLVQDAWTTVSDWVKDKIGGAVEKAVGLAKDGWTKVSDWIKDNIGGAISKAIGLEKKGWTNIANWVKDNLGGAVSKAIGLAKNGWDSVSGWVKDKFGSAAVNVSIGLKKTWSSIKNWIKENITNKISSIKIPFKMPTITLKTGSKTFFGKKITYPTGFKIKWNAKGAVLDGAQIFGSAGSTLLGGGEAGREALLPLDKNTDWMDTIADKVKQKVADTIGSVTVQSAQLDAGALLRKCTPVLAAMERSGEQTAAAAKAAEAERSASDTRRIETLLEAILALLKDIDPVALDAESLRKYFIRVTNRNTQANSGRCELKV